MAEDFLARIQPSGMVSTERVADSQSGSPEDRTEREGKELLKALRPRDRLVLLREDGPQYDSVGFARFLSREMESAQGRVVFAIGGPWGTSEALKARSDAGLALSQMTFTHEMCLLFLTEQLYRAFSIIQGTGYHH